MVASKSSKSHLCFDYAGGRNKDDHMSEFLYVLFGFLSGIFGGRGMGGGTLLIPLLTIFLGVDQKLAQGINLIAFLVMALLSLCIHFKNGYLKGRGVVYIIISGVIFSSLSALVAGYLPSRILRICFGVFLCGLAVLEFVKVFKK